MNKYLKAVLFAISIPVLCIAVVFSCMAIGVYFLGSVFGGLHKPLLFLFLFAISASLVVLLVTVIKKKVFYVSAEEKKPMLIGLMFGVIVTVVAFSLLFYDPYISKANKLFKKAKIEKNELICEQIATEYNRRDDCFSCLAKLKNDILICKKLKDYGSRVYCYYNIQKINNDANICLSLENQKEINSCYIAFGAINNDTSICDKVKPDPESQESLDDARKDCRVHIKLDNIKGSTFPYNKDCCKYF